MRKKGYTNQNKPKYYSSYKGNLGGVVNNIINQDFITTKPYEKCGTDNVKEERVYLSPIIDFNSREALSYDVGTNAKVIKVIKMLEKLKINHGDK